MLNRQIRNAPPRIQLIRRRKSLRRTDVQTSSAGPAMRSLGRVRFKIQRGEDRPKEHPVPQITPQQVGMLALPPQPRRLRQGLLHHRRRIDEHLDLRPRGIDQPPPQPLQPPLHQVVVVLPLRIDRDHPPVPLRQPRHRIAIGRIRLRQHDHRPRLGPKRRRRPAPFLPLGHPVHLPVPPRLQETSQPPRSLRHRVRPTHSHLHKPLLQGPRYKLLFRQPFHTGENIPRVRGLAPDPPTGSEIQVGIMRRGRKARNLIRKQRPE